MLPAEAVPWRHASLNTLTSTTSPASVQEYDLFSAGNDTIECSFKTSRLSNYAVPRSARGPQAFSTGKAVDVLTLLMSVRIRHRSFFFLRDYLTFSIPGLFRMG